NTVPVHTLDVYRQAVADGAGNRSRCQRPLQEFQGALASQRGAGAVMIRALVTVYPVAGRIDMDLRRGPCLAVLGDRVGWNDRITFAEVHQQRCLWRFVQEWHRATAVITHGRQAMAGIGKERDRATPAEADGSDPADGTDCFGCADHGC